VQSRVDETYNWRVKFGLKIPSRLGKMSENLRGDFLTNTMEFVVITVRHGSVVPTLFVRPVTRFQ